MSGWIIFALCLLLTLRLFFWEHVKKIQGVNMGDNKSLLKKALWIISFIAFMVTLNYMWLPGYEAWLLVQFYFWLSIILYLIGVVWDSYFKGYRIAGLFNVLSVIVILYTIGINLPKDYWLKVCTSIYDAPNRIDPEKITLNPGETVNIKLHPDGYGHTPYGRVTAFIVSGTGNVETSYGLNGDHNYLYEQNDGESFPQHALESNTGPITLEVWRWTEWYNPKNQNDKIEDSWFYSFFFVVIWVGLAVLIFSIGKAFVGKEPEVAVATHGSPH